MFINLKPKSEAWEIPSSSVVQSHAPGLTWRQLCGKQRSGQATLNSTLGIRLDAFLAAGEGTDELEV